MRLQLVIQRQSLPPVQLLWTLRHLCPPLAAAGGSFTICQLLEQINEIIPLEAEDWGLEDYAVEVGGFECLHFSEISHVLKEDDVVCIRPLQPSDLRFRKISGRHQISADGKHLIDGVAFGRPFLRQANRPPIRIPRRKRRRVTYEERDESVSNAHNRQIAVTRLHNGDRGLAESDSQDGEDISLYEAGEDRLSLELEDIYNDNDAGDTTPRTTNLDDMPRRLTRSKAKSGPANQVATGLKLVDENGIPYPNVYRDALLDLFAKDPLHPPRPSTKKRREGNQRLTNRAQEQTAVKVYRGQPEHSRRHSSSTSVRFEDVDSTTPATIRNIQDSDRSSDEDFEPADDIMQDPDESDKENSQPNFETHVTRGSSSNKTSSSSSTSSEVLQDDTTSSSESSSAENSSDSEPDQIPSTSVGQPLCSETSSPSESSSSGSDTKTERVVGKIDETVAAVSSTSPMIANYNSKGSETKNKRGIQFTQHNSLPFQGKKCTQLRNQRRRNKRKLERIRNGVLLPSDAATDPPKRVGDQSNITTLEKSIKDPKADMVGLCTHSQLDPDASLGELVSPDPFRKSASAPTWEKPTGHIDEATIEGMRSRFVDNQTGDTCLSTGTAGEPTRALAVTEVTLNQKSTLKARSKLDLASSRRMLFGSLGLRTPKSAQDELETREKLMKSFRPVKESHSHNAATATRSFTAGELEENENWTQKIVLRAVECCYEGIELSTPPFPFVQRWDPQQQGSNKGFVGGKRKSKKRKRNESQFNQRVFEQKSEDGERFAHILPPSGVEDLDENNTTWNTDNQQSAVQQKENDEDEVAVNQPFRRDIVASANDSAEYRNTQDLPVLPEDLSTCISLTTDMSTPGAIIAFKQLDMSQETNWQPRVSEYRTATVGHLIENGMLRIILAQRDRPQNQKSYDMQTGERIYSKFEMPGMDEEPIEDGVIELSFAELIDPKLICSGSAEKTPLVDRVNDQQCSVHGGGLRGEVDVTMPEADDQLPVDSIVLNTRSPDGSLDAHETDKGREGVRKEIFDLIKDAGWRSSVGLNIVEGKVSSKHLSLTDQIDEKQKESSFPSSPNSPDFGSSPHIAARNPTKSGEQNSPVDKTDDKEEESAIPDSPNFSGFNSVPPTAAGIEVNARMQDPLTDQTNGDEEESAFPISPNFPGFCSSPPTSVRIKAMFAKQRTEGLTSDPKSSPKSTNGFGFAESLPPQPSAESKSPPTRSSSFGDENFDQKIDDNDEDLGWKEPPLTSDILEADHQVASQELNSPTSESPLHAVQSDTKILERGSPSKPAISSDSENEFPRLEDVFSQIRSSHEPSSFQTEDSTYMRTSSFETVIPKEEPVSSLPAREVRPHDKGKLPQKQTLFAWPESEGENRIIRGSQAPIQSETVDLTLSNDAAPDDEDVDRGSQLPAGPGWVQKTRASVGRNDTVKGGRGRPRRTRST